VRVATVEWDARDFSAQYEAVAQEAADLVVLPEMPFSPWLPDSRRVDPGAWDRAVATHEEALGRLADLGARVVVGSRPVTAPEGRFNESFVWADGQLLAPVHRKTFLPDEEGYWEASWYGRGPVAFAPVDTPLGRIGVVLCTELWFFEHARALGRQDVDLLLVPRATPALSVPKWVAGGTAAAVVSGAFCISANHSGRYPSAHMGGGSWIIEPEEGGLVALTAADRAVVTAELDLEVARTAKRTYPRYVVDGDPAAPASS